MEVIDLTNEPLPPALPPMLPAAAPPALLPAAAPPAAAAAQPEFVDLVSDSSSEDLTPDSEEGASDESSEEETLAQRIKRRTGRAHVQNAYSYQSLELQQQKANQETVELSDLLEVRTVPGMDRGLFAKTNIDRHQISISYFGRHFSSETLYLQSFPNDDAAYVMTHEGEYFDGEPVEQLGKYVNHSRSKKNLGLNAWAAADEFKGESDASANQQTANKHKMDGLNKPVAAVSSWSQMGLVASMAPDSVHQNVGSVHF
eukprot:COSAG06_NODE_3903_length_4790_cov_53.937527_5_plen_258_part_00